MTVWYKQKTTWVGIVTILAGLIQGVFDKDWGMAVEKILLGAAMITGRQALSKLER